MSITIYGSGTIGGLVSGWAEDLTITTADLVDGAVTNAKIDTVANTKVTGVITTAQLAATTGSGAVVLATSPTISGNVTLSGTTTLSDALVQAVGANTASAGTLNLTTVAGNATLVTGTTTITAVTLATGKFCEVIFNGILTLTHHATNNNLPGAANITTAAKDRASYWSDGTTVYCRAYQRADGTAVVSSAVTAAGVSDQSNSSTGYFDLPSGTTAQRPGSPASGMIRYNSTLDATEYYNGTAWYSMTAMTVVSAVEYLVVAGGAGGGSGYGGGGGGGGLRSSVVGSTSGGGGAAEATLAVSTATPYTITVGLGGAGTSGPNISGTNGSNSVFSSITSIGGGGGGWRYSGGTDSAGGSSGGSGGGSGDNYPGSTLRAGGAATANQGYAGGGGTFVPYLGGGGGGAGAVGASSSNSGTGGAGQTNSITGSAVFYAGGGGGGNNSTQSGGQGGAGGGGRGGGAPGVGIAGTVNTGGGGGGGSDSSPASGAGGSGIVIIRYADSYFAATSTTGSPTITVANGYRVYSWTANGSITF